MWEGPRIIGRPLVGLSDDEPFIGAIILTEAFLRVVLVLDVLHVRDDGLGVEAVLFIGPELLLVELLTLHPARIDLPELGEVGVAVLVGLGGVVSNLRAV